MTENPRNAMVWATPYLKNEFGDPRFFLRFLSNLIIFCRQSKFLKNLCVGSFWARTSVRRFSEYLCTFGIAWALYPCCASDQSRLYFILIFDQSHGSGAYRWCIISSRRTYNLRASSRKFGTSRYAPFKSAYVAWGVNVEGVEKQNMLSPSPLPSTCTSPL